jgi:hypothetical protein
VNIPPKFQECPSFPGSFEMARTRRIERLKPPKMLLLSDQFHLDAEVKEGRIE